MTPINHLGTRRTARRVIWLAAAACLALSLIGVAAAQSSINFDLACRGMITVTGGVRPLSGGNMALIGSAGQPGAGRSTSARFGVRGGYVQPYSIEGQVAQAAVPEDGHFMPFIARAAHIVRVCEW